MVAPWIKRRRAKAAAEAAAPAPVVEKVVEAKPAPKRKSYKRKLKTEE